MGRLFVSHSTADKAVADALADLLRLGTDLPRARIICSSLEGMGIPEGVDDYITYLRGELQDATLVLPLITPSFFESQVCLVELGAMWGMQLPAFPMVVPPATFAQVEAVLGKVQCARIDESSGLARLRDRIVKDFGVDAPTDVWDAKRRQFMTRWSVLKSSVPGPSRVSAIKYAESLERVASVEAKLTELGVSLNVAQDRLKQVSALKDRDQVATLMLPSNERAHFDELARGAAVSLRQFTPVVRRAFYENIGRREPYTPEEQDLLDANNAVRDDQLVFDEESGYWINDTDPAVEDAASAVRSVFDHSWSEEMLDAFKGEYRKNFSRSSEPTWRVLRLL